MGSNPTASLKIVKNKKYYSWILYDWANSAFATIVLAGFFPIIFADYFASSFTQSERTLVLGISNSSASLLLILIAPFLGLLADRKGNKLKYLALSAFIGITATLFLTFVEKDAWAIASMLFSISLFGFMLSNVFYDSMLLSFDNSKDLNSMSSFGYAAGYLGGGIAFILALFFLFYFKESSHDFIVNKKIIFIFTSLWWFLFSIPLFLYWKDTNKPKEQQKYSLFDTFKDIKADKRLLYFLLAYWIYIDGVDTIIRMAVNFGITIGFSSNDLLIALLVTQFVSFPGTILINSIAGYKTSEFSIMLCLVIYILITLIAYNLNTIFEFYLIAVLIGLAQGGIQALSRSYYARIIPKHRSSEYFGVYNMLGKFAALLGPLFVGFITYYTDDSRLGMLSISLFFIIGIYFFKKQCMLIKQE